jgi:hypothetical protein
LVVRPSRRETERGARHGCRLQLFDVHRLALRFRGIARVRADRAFDHERLLAERHSQISTTPESNSKNNTA